MLVRLKGSKWSIPPNTLTYFFRFHTGSIKRETFERPRYPLLLFRFHTGSIKRKSANPAATKNSAFRFHIGSIKVRFGFRGASIGFR